MASLCFPDGQNVTSLLLWIWGLGGSEVSSEPAQRNNPQSAVEGVLPMVGVSSFNGAGVSSLNGESHSFLLNGGNQPFQLGKVAIVRDENQLEETHHFQ